MRAQGLKSRAEGPGQLGAGGSSGHPGTLERSLCHAGVRNGLRDRCPGLRPRRERGCSWGPQGEAGDEEDKWTKVAKLSPQETSVPQELLVTVLKPGLPTLADLYVLLPPPRPTRKRSLSSDKVCPVVIGLPGPPCAAQGSGHLQQAGTSQWLMA